MMKLLLKLTLFSAIVLNLTLFPSANANIPSSSKNKKAFKTYFIKSGDTIYSILKKFGFSPQQSRMIFANPDLPKRIELIPGQLYRTYKYKKQLVLKIYEMEDDFTHTFYKDINNFAAYERAPEDFFVKRRKISGKISGSLIQSIDTQVKDKQVAYKFMNAYLLYFNLKKVLKRNAKFSLVYEQKFSDGSFIKNGEVLSTDLEINGDLKSFHFIAFDVGGSFVTDDQLSNKRIFYSPVNYMNISSVYQPRRYHPIKKTRRAHLGVDFALETGSPIYTVASGTVIKKGRTRGAGRYLAIKHKNGFTSYYNHMNGFAPKMKVGEKVKNGQFIGEIGCSGYCTKPHLHFAIKKHGRYINPQKYLLSYPYNKKTKIEKAVAKIRSRNQITMNY